MRLGTVDAETSAVIYPYLRALMSAGLFLKSTSSEKRKGGWVGQDTEGASVLWVMAVGPQHTTLNSNSSCSDLTLVGRECMTSGTAWGSREHRGRETGAIVVWEHDVRPPRQKPQGALRP
jgi:hypothetical protein